MRLAIKVGYYQYLCPKAPIEGAIEFLAQCIPVKTVNSYSEPVRFEQTNDNKIEFELVPDDCMTAVNEDFYKQKFENAEKERSEADSAKWTALSEVRELKTKLENMEAMLAKIHASTGEPLPETEEVVQALAS